MARTGFTRRWRTLTVPAPAVGTDWTLAATGEAYRRVVSLRASLATSGVVANRVVRLQADNGERSWFATQSGLSQTAGTTTIYSAFTGATPAGVLSGVVNLTLPHAGLLLLPGYRLAVVTAGLDVGDQWSSVQALIDESPSDVPYIGDDGWDLSPEPEE